jgi:transposase
MPTPLDPRGEDEELALCERFLEQAKTENRGPEFRATLDRLYDLVKDVKRLKARVEKLEKTLKRARRAIPGIR